jgi:hypothetical protein
VVDFSTRDLERTDMTTNPFTRPDDASYAFELLEQQRAEKEQVEREQRVARRLETLGAFVAVCGEGDVLAWAKADPRADKTSQIYRYAAVCSGGGWYITGRVVKPALSANSLIIELIRLNLDVVDLVRFPAAAVLRREVTG